MMNKHNTTSFGYTSKLAGTERGITEPTPSFFQHLARHSLHYTQPCILKTLIGKMKEHG